MADLTPDDLQRMIIELVTGKEPTLTTPEANAARERLRKEIAEIEAKGGMVDIPSPD